jgi:hypothetical protein
MSLRSEKLLVSITLGGGFYLIFQLVAAWAAEHAQPAPAWMATPLDAAIPAAAWSARRHGGVDDRGLRRLRADEATLCRRRRGRPRRWIRRAGGRHTCAANQVDRFLATPDCKRRGS